MTAGQPQNLTATSVFFIYLNSFPYLKLGYGAALSVILAGIIVAFTASRWPSRGGAIREHRALQPATQALGRSRSLRLRGRVGRGGYLVAAVCLLLCALMVMPIILAVAASLKTTEEAAA